MPLVNGVKILRVYIYIDWVKTLAKEDYLAQYDSEMYGSIHEQPWAKKISVHFIKKTNTQSIKVKFVLKHGT